MTGKPWKTTATLTKRTRIPTEGGFRTEFDRVEVPLEFDIDWSGLARELGQKAFENKSDRSKFLNGLIIVRVAKTKKAAA